MINWKVRLKNKYFWLTFISAVVLLVQAIFKIIGVDIDITNMNEQFAEIVEAVFIILALFGVVNDPTTAGIKDSRQALTYTVPKED